MILKMKQEDRNEIAVRMAKFLNKQKPKPDILDCLDILNNLQDGFTKELIWNFKKFEEKSKENKKSIGFGDNTNLWENEK